MLLSKTLHTLQQSRAKLGTAHFRAINKKVRGKNSPNLAPLSPPLPRRAQTRLLTTFPRPLQQSRAKAVAAGTRTLGGRNIEA